MWDHVRGSFEQSLQRIATAVGAFLPGLVAFIAVVLVAFALAWLARAFLQRLLTGIRFDELIHHWGFASTAEWPTLLRPSSLTARLGFWLVLFAGFMLGLTVFDAAAATALAYRVLGYLPDVIAAAVLFVAGLFLARFLERSVLVSAVNMQLKSARLLSLGVKWLIIILAAAIAMQHLGVGGILVTISFSILFGGIVLALALAVGLGSREAVSRTLEKKMGQEETSVESEVRHL
ncbi:MAG TPA: hypothetical protein VMK12_28650 [Anaeromyxobacteraceae bacterium]|nr:hypothetical protein [Anaeromyxobacteraceae bacterium]